MKKIVRCLALSTIVAVSALTLPPINNIVFANEAVGISPRFSTHSISLDADVSEVLGSWVNIRHPRGIYTGADRFAWGTWFLGDGAIKNDANTAKVTGFYNPGTNYADMDISVDLGSAYEGDDDMLGIVFRFSQVAGQDTPTNYTLDDDITNDGNIDDDRFTGYALLMDSTHQSTAGGNGIQGARLVKMENGLLIGDTHNLNDIPYLAAAPGHSWYNSESPGDLVTIRIVTKGSNIKIYREGQLIIDCTDPEPINSGSYGFVTFSQPLATFTNIKGTATYTRANITYDGNGEGSSLSGTTVVNRSSLETYGTQPTATRPGYTFKEWNTKADGTGQTITSDTPVNVTSDINLYAVWTPKSYSLHFDTNGGNVTPPITFTNDKKLGSLPTPVKTGYTFKGWVDSSGNIVNQNTVWSNKTTSQTLTATWEVNQYELTGTIVNQWGNTAPDLEVSFGGISTKTDNQGKFSITTDYSRNQQRYVISGEGYDTYEGYTVLGTGKNLGDIVVQKTFYTSTLNIVDDNGNSVEGAEVNIDGTTSITGTTGNVDININVD